MAVSNKQKSDYFKNILFIYLSTVSDGGGAPTPGIKGDIILLPTQRINIKHIPRFKNSYSKFVCVIVRPVVLFPVICNHEMFTL